MRVSRSRRAIGCSRKRSQSVSDDRGDPRWGVRGTDLWSVDGQEVLQRKRSANDSLDWTVDNMTPLFDRREELGNEPGVHALIVGVSDYSNLAGYDDPAREQHWGMKKLGSAALSAYRIHQWLW